MATSRTAVVLVCHLAYRAFLPEALHAVDTQLRPFDLKVLVLDIGFGGDPLPVRADGWTVVPGNWREPNEARNTGMREAIAAGAEWVTFWDADNRMPVDYHALAAPVLRNAELNTAVCYPHVQEVLENGTHGHLFSQPEWSLENGRGKSLCDSASFWRSEALIEVGGFPPNQHGPEDYAMSLRMWQAGWRGQRLGISIEHLTHPGSRTAENDVTHAHWCAWSFGFVTLWSGNLDTGRRVLDWLNRAEIPPRSVLYWVDNSGGTMTELLLAEWAAKLRHRFQGLVMINAGSPHRSSEGDAYLDIRRHGHVAHLYNRILPRVREEIVVTLEDDVIPPHGGVRELLALIRPFERTALASGVYRARHSPGHICASRCKERWDDAPNYDALPAEPFEVGMTGGGFALIGNWALQPALPMRCGKSREGWLMGWDGNLGLALQQAGYRLMAHPGVKCQHLCREVIEFKQGGAACSRCGKRPVGGLYICDECAEREPYGCYYPYLYPA